MLFANELLFALPQESIMCMKRNGMKAINKAVSLKTYIDNYSVMAEHARISCELEKTKVRKDYGPTEASHT